MTNGDLEAFRALIREELAPIRTTVEGLGTTVGGLGTTVGDLGATVEVLGTTVEGLNTTVEGLGTTVEGLNTTVEGLGTTVEGLNTTLEGMRGTLEAMRPNVDGIPLIRRAVGVLQDEVRGLREEITVVAATTIRLDNTRERHEALLTEMLQEIRAMHARHRGHETRIRHLEGHDD